MNAQMIILIVIVAIAAIMAISQLVMNIVAFIELPQEKKEANVREWLKYAVVEAEKALGSGTGQLKLRLVYDMAVRQFPWLSQIVPFGIFSVWVDEALEWMNCQISTNKNTKDYIEKK